MKNKNNKKTAFLPTLGCKNAVFVENIIVRHCLRENYSEAMDKDGKIVQDKAQPRKTGDGVVAYSEPSIAGATQYWTIFAS